MRPGARSRFTVTQVARLGVAVPAWAVGTALLLTTLLPVFLFWWALAAAFLVAVSAVGLAVVYAGRGTIPASPLTENVLLAVRWVSIAGIGAVLLHRVYRVVRSRHRSEAASLLADTRVPETDRDRRVRRAVERLCQQADQPTPTVRIRQSGLARCYTLDCPEPMTRTVGGGLSFDAPAAAEGGAAVPAGPVLVVSTGLVDLLPPEELTAVLAHEVAHLRNRDLTLMTWLLVPVHWSGDVLPRTETGESEPIRVGPALVGRLLVALPALVARPVSYLGAVTYSRGREFAADAAAARLTGDPVALASALERLDADVERPAEDLRVVHVLNVLPALDRRWTARLSHPSTERRVERLRALRRETGGP